MLFKKNLSKTYKNGVFNVLICLYPEIVSNSIL